MEALDQIALEAALETVPEWRYDAGRRAIERGFKFASFAEAFGFMVEVAFAAEKADHHPDWSNSYNRVTISLTTHSAGGLSGKDFALAAEINRIARA